ncbi:MAG: hypothetical protein JKX81_12540 [Arenicella sp.]|nr:hypothetical protein [Arenicella sp.]
MVSKVKLYHKLDLLESQLKEGLVAHLKEAAEGKNELLFCVTAFNPFAELKGRTDKLTEEFVDIGAQILALRAKLGEPSDGTIAERLCWYCRQWSNSGNGYKTSGKGLARQFLLEIDNE